MTETKLKPRKSKLELREPAKPLQTEARTLDPNHPAAQIFAAVKSAEVPTHQTPPLSPTPPTSQPAPFQHATQPLPETPAAQQTAPFSQVGAGHTRITHDVTDRVLATLDTYSQAVLIQLLRLAWGFQRDMCRVGLPTLSKRANISESQARRAARRLVEMGYVEELGKDFNNKNQAERGTIYRIILSPPPTRLTGGGHQTPPALVTPNKEKEIKKDKKGEVAPLNFQNCPDCRGTGFWYPEGVEKGVAKCQHENLSLQS